MFHYNLIYIYINTKNVHEICIAKSMTPRKPHHVLIIADSGPSVGYGHVARCLALCDGLTTYGISLTLAASAMPAFLEERAKASKVTVLRPEQMHMDFILPFLAKAAPDALVVDSYLLVDDARQSLAALNIPMIYLDDGRGQKLPKASMVINPSPFANVDAYKKTAPDATLLLGADYSYLSAHFWPENRSKTLSMCERDHILISFGGADPLQLTAAVTEGLMPLCEMGVHIDVVLPAKFEKKATLPQHCSIHWHQNLPSLAPLMQKVGLAVAQIGGTMGELATMGVPSIILMSDKEGEGFAAPHPDLAWNLPVPSHTVANADLPKLLVTKATNLWHDTALREQLAKTGQKIVDGRGIRRISQALKEHLS